MCAKSPTRFFVSPGSRSRSKNIHGRPSSPTTIFRRDDRSPRLVADLNVEVVAITPLGGGLFSLDLEFLAPQCALRGSPGDVLDTLGGVFEVVAFNPLPGLGSHVSGDRRLDGQLGQAILGIQAIKGVEIGAGFDLGRVPGSQAHDEIFYEEGRGYYRTTNRSGGLEGGMTHGGPLTLRAVMKPISTLTRPLASVDVQSKLPETAFRERADTCAALSQAHGSNAVASSRQMNAPFSR